MLNLFNNTNNLSLFNHNLLNYGLILGSVGIIGYSMYYFTGCLSKVYAHKSINTLPNAETFTQRLVENLESKPVPNLDNIVPTMSNKVDAISKGINTDGTNLVESAVQTDQSMLYDYMKELLYNQGTPTTSLGEISPT